MLASGVSTVDAGLTNVFSDHTACANDDIVANIDRQNRGIRANGNTIAYHSRFPLRLIASSRTTRRKQIVDEHGAVANEAIITNCHQFANKRMRLNTTAITYRDSFLDFYERPYETIVTNLAAVQITWLNNRYVLTKLDVSNRDLEGAGFHRTLS